MSQFDVRECAVRLRPWIIKTPLVENEYLSDQVGKKVYLKLENMQRTGAFKFRGAMNYMLTLDKSLAGKGVITASSGNHGLGMSLSGKLVGLKCTVVMPETAPLVKQNKAKGYGASVILHGSCYDEAQEHARVLADREGYAYVPSFNHPAIIEGQGTVMKEIHDELPEADVFLAPVGGGGLISGMLLAAEQLEVKGKIVGVEPYGAACMTASLQAGRLVTLENMATIADGVAVRTPGSLNYELVNRFNPMMLGVSDDEVVAAQKLLLQEAKLIVETAGAVPVAALLKDSPAPEVKAVVCVISGANVDLSYLKKVM